jgi:Ca2+-binding RTX toxin-like protein
MSSTPLPAPEALLADAIASGAAASLPATDTIDAAAAAGNIVGTAGNDTLNGSANADQISGLAGNDTLNGRAGNDMLLGGDGNDVLTGGTGDDQLFGEAGDDRIIWNEGDGNDIVDGGSGTDRLEIHGNDSAETIQIAANGTGVFAAVTTGTVTSTLDVSGVESLTVSTGGGNDSIVAGNGLSTLTSLTIDGGAGNDTITGGDGADTLLGGSGDDVITGGRGNDVALLGGGSDVFVWNPGDGSDAVEGNDGADTLQFNGANISEEMVLSASGTHATLTRNVGATTMDLHSVENVNIRALGGTDNITIGDLRSTDVDHVHVDLSPVGGGDDGAVDAVTLALTADNDALNFAVGSSVINELGALVFIDNAGVGDHFVIDSGAGIDTVTANGTGGDDVIGIALDGSNVAVFGSGGPAVEVTGVEQLLVKGGDGNDSISAGNGIAALTQLTIDGGNGNDTIIGGDGADTLIGGTGNDVITGGRGNDVALLGSGSDVFVWNPGDGSDVVEGNDGADTLQFNGSNANEDMVLSGSGSHAILTRNVGAITMDLHSMENVNIRALGGTDHITIGDLRSTDVDHVHVDLSPVGGGDDGAVDAVTLALTTDNDALDFAVGSSVINELGALVFIDNAGVGDHFVIDGGAGADTVTANGTGGDDVIGIALDGSNVAVFGSGGPAVEVTGVEQLLVKGGDGNDTIAGQNGIAALTQLTIDGGAGNDTILGGDGNDVLIGGSGNDFVDGNRGNDVASLGSGDDVFGWDPGDGSDVVEGNGGTDTLQFNGSNASEDMVLSASGSHAILTRNVGAVTMDLHGMENVNIRALGGTDHITIGDLRGSDVDQVHVDLSPITGGADGAADTVSVAGTAAADTVIAATAGGETIISGLAADVHVTGADAALDQLSINTGAQNDSIDASALAADGMALSVDAGAGNDHIVGSAGSDVIVGGAGADVALMGVGNDTFVWNAGDGSDTVEGEAGTDTLRFNASDASETIDLSANGDRVRMTRDVDGVTMDLHGVENIDVNALGGADKITVHDLSGTGTTQVNIDLAAQPGVSGGDHSADTVVIEGTEGDDAITLTLLNGALVVDGLAAQIVIENFDATTDQIQVLGLGGDDVIQGSFVTAGGPALSFDGGAGDDVLIGGDGSDLLLGGLGDDVLIGGPGQDVLDGGPGNNVLIQ